MLEVAESKLLKQRVFQVLLLYNDSSQEVELHESEEVDFLRLWNHLERGGSAFITSKNSQKLRIPKQKRLKSKNQNEMKTLTTFFFDHV